MPIFRGGHPRATADAAARRRDDAAYVAALTDDLAKIARRNGLGTLAYLLDMARLEAETAARLPLRDVDRRPPRRASQPALDGL